MSFRTYEEEVHNQLIDDAVRSLLDLASVLLVSRTDEQLTHHVLPTSVWCTPQARLLPIDFSLPRIENIRHGIEHTQELLEKVDSHMRATNHRLRNELLERVRETGADTAKEIKL